MRRAPKNPSTQPTVEQSAADLSRMAVDHVLKLLEKDPLRLGQTTRAAYLALTVDQRKEAETRYQKLWEEAPYFQKRLTAFEATNPAAPSQPEPKKDEGLAGPLGRLFGKAGSVIGTVVDWTADAFKRLNDDLQQAVNQRDEARADARHLYDAFMRSGLPSQEVLQRVATYAVAEKKKDKEASK